MIAMNKNTLTALLDDLRALILKSRPAYRDYLGENVEHKTIPILTNVVLPKDRDFFSPEDSTFSGFLAGETYHVTLDGNEFDAIAITINGGPGISNISASDVESGTIPSDTWSVGTSPEVPNRIACGASGSFVGKTISVRFDKIIVKSKWSVKKLAYELLPDRLLSALSDVANIARKALTAANAAQSTANAAQSTADNALPKAGGNIEGSVDVSGNLSAGEVIVRASGNERVYTVLSCKNEEVGEVSRIGFARSGGVALVSIGNTGYTADTIKSAQVSLDLGKNKGITFYHDGNAYHMRCGGPLDLSTGDSVNGWAPIQVQGISGIIMHSSTSGSTKKLKITVDDTGTLSATEVTDSTT